MTEQNKPSVFEVKQVQITEEVRKKITNIELNNENPNNRFARLRLCEVTTRNGEITKQDLIREFIETYSQDTAQTVYTLKDPTDGSILGEATYEEFFIHVNAFATHVAEREAEKMLIEQENMEKMMENMEKQAELQRQREALDAEYRANLAALEV